MALFGNYESSGAGIAKDAPKKKPFFQFWELVGRKFWKLMSVNLIMTVSILPLFLAVVAVLALGADHTGTAMLLSAVCILLFVFLFGPTMAACAKVLRYFSIEKPCFLLSTFFDAFKENYGQAFVLGLIDILVGASVASGFYVYPRLIAAMQSAEQDGTGMYYALFVATLSIAIVVLMMSFYGYLMIVSTELKMKDILKNSLALSFIALKKNLLTLVIAAAVMGLFAVLTYYMPYFMAFVWIFMPSAYVAFLIVFNCYPVIQKYVIDPFYAQRGEVSPEMTYAQTEGENLFEDQGGREAPIEPKKKGKKGKIIS